ncbi:adenylate/guanylate cyclase domain-containing protein [[Phormidium ambiguum] IAM M-71]|uniref:adenylate/guanylate cyclase domain-containing protein n=1 Tax=[Phormidium ambiguum] IAM M-71 TaxID=454136 RepID=UPI0009FF6928
MNLKTLYQNPQGFGQKIQQLWDKLQLILLKLLYKRTILILAILFCTGVAGSLWNVSRLSWNLIESQALENAALYVQTIQAARTLYSSDAVNRIKEIHEITVTHDYKNKAGAIPLPATYLIELGKEVIEKNAGMSVRLYSDYPFPWRQAEGGARDDFELQALRYLRLHPEQPFYRFIKAKDSLKLRYTQADILQPSCVNCHNTHPSSPKTDWKVGDVRGVLEINSSLDNLMHKTNEGLQGTFITLGMLSMFGLFGLTLVITRLRDTSKELELRVIERTSELQKANDQLADEREKSERLLLNILPEPIADRLKEGHKSIADGFAEVTILFADLVNFTGLSEKVTPTELVALLNDIFSAFDRLTEKHSLEKIKTIGDAYMVAGGIPNPRKDHVQCVVEMALDMQEEIRKFNAENDYNLNIRIGINTGPVVAGVIGTKKFIYDLWGDTVNVASRMESHGLIGEIQVTEKIYEMLSDRYNFISRGSVNIKGKGEMITYLLISRKE